MQKKYDYSDAAVPQEWKFHVRKDVQEMLDAFWDADAEETEALNFYEVPDER